MDYYNRAAEHMRARYKFRNPKPHGRRATSGISIINEGIDSSYIGTVNIGTPAQSFDVVLDTGSSDLWVAGANCQGCTSKTPVFQPSQSTSLQLSQQTTNIQYGSGQVNGQIGADITSMAGFVVPAQTLLIANAVSSELLEDNISGIMGLAFSTISSTQSTPFWEALANNGQFSSPEMSFWLTRFGNDPTATEEEPGGVFTLGGTNSSLFTGDIDFLNMPANPSFWLLTLNSVTVQGKSVPITASTALSAIDTGTTLIGGPTNDVQAIWSAVPGSQTVPNQKGFFSFPCTTNVEVTLSFGGNVWPINIADMNLGPVTQGSSQCLGAIFDLSLGSTIVGGDGNPSWVVGDTFLKNVYSVFRSNPPSIGFAQLSAAAGGSGTPSVTPGGSNNNNGGSKLGNAVTRTTLASIVAGLLACIL